MTSRPFIRRFAMAAFAAAILSSAAYASELNTTDGVAIKGYDAVAYFTDHAAVRGSDAFTAEYDGAVFKFASAAHRDAFLAEPTKYLPQYGGFCAYGTAEGHKADTDPEAFTVYEDHLYLNYSKEVAAKWRNDIPGNLAKADKRWPTVSQSTEVYR